MSEMDGLHDLLVDSFTRVADLVAELAEDLGEEVATFRPDEEANSVAWLLWHLTRVQDDHVAELAGVEQVWPRWRDRFGLPFEAEATGYGQDPAETAAVRVPAALLAGYHADVHHDTVRYLDSLAADDLTRVVDEDWDPPVTVSIRLVSVLGDTMQHLGQAAYVVGLAQRSIARSGGGR